MERRRLYLGNIPLDITHVNLVSVLKRCSNDLFDIELKQKKDIEGNVLNQFAFVNIIGDKNMTEKVFKDLSVLKFNNSPIKVEWAKESFLERLNKERSQCSTQTSSNNAEIKQTNICSKYKNALEKQFNVTTKLMDSLNNFSSVWKQESDDQLSKQIFQENLNKSETNQTDQDFQIVSKKYNVKLDYKNNQTHRVKPNEYYNDEGSPSTSYIRSNKWSTLNDEKSCKTDNTYDPNKYRLDALKERSETIKKKNNIIKDSLAGKNTLNKKIKFDKEEENETVSSKHTCKLQLFEDTDNFEEEVIKINPNKKLKTFVATNTLDDRFKMDKRFYESDDSTGEHIDEQDEKTNEYATLSSILGYQVQKTKLNNSYFKPYFRYDPTDVAHKIYEKNTETTVNEKTTAQKENQNIFKSEVSSDVKYKMTDEFYDNLKSGKQDSEFSLLKIFGNPEKSVENNLTYENEEIKMKKKPIENNFVTEENYNNADEAVVTTNLEKPIEKYSFFFEEKDARYEESENFFKRQLSENFQEFLDRREKLKKIVRRKYKNNQLKMRKITSNAKVSKIKYHRKLLPRRRKLIRNRCTR